MEIKGEQVAFRDDKYSIGIFCERNGKKENIYFVNQNDGADDFVKIDGIKIRLLTELKKDILKYIVDIEAVEDFRCERLGLCLGVDCYMKSYPEWNDKFFPTALRCESNGFWGAFCSPTGKILAVASPSEIVSWSNEYNTSAYGEVGHRIYTASVDFLNANKLPQRHIKRDSFLKGEKLHYEIFMGIVADKKGIYDFVLNFAGIKVPEIECFLLEKDKTKYDYGIHIISDIGQAESSVYVRREWFYYLDAARKNAEKCQQKLGTHTESWYGFFSLVAYAKVIKDKEYTKYVKERFDKFFHKLTKGRRTIKFRAKALPHRLQNVSCMLSLLADMYELTQDTVYLDYADDLAKWLMKLQAKDGSYRNHGVHYTCVIYPAKSMLELALAERDLYPDRYQVHFNSAYKAIQNLYDLMDNIQTEGQMTFEDGMISCEALQLGYLATLCEGEERKKLTEACEIILAKHRCLEQFIVPDCRTHGATLRYWEARYDINFSANMLNTPHGWTSWKTYATYYAYILTGKSEYLIDTMNTIGACMQMVDEEGNLNWAFVIDPCIIGNEMVKSTIKEGIKFMPRIVGEEYLPMVSDWYRQPKNKFVHQYLRSFNAPKLLRIDYGGSCDNDVHEHFKCLDETVFGKAFIHERSNGEYLLFNCYMQDNNFASTDKYVRCYVVCVKEGKEININNKSYLVKQGINIISL